MTTLTFTRENSFCIYKDNQDAIAAWAAGETLPLSYWKFSTVEDLTDTFPRGLTTEEQLRVQTHLNIWRHVVRYNIPYVIIVEDTAEIPSNWKDIAGAMVNKPCFLTRDKASAYIISYGMAMNILIKYASRPLETVTRILRGI